MSTGPQMARPAMSSTAALLALPLLALCYYAMARAGLQLAFANSNATPVWPPSGIALAAMLAMGYRVWPAILLGAFAANVAAFHFNGLPLDARLVLVSLTIALGNTAEAVCGAALLRRFGDPARPFSQLHNVYKYVLVAMAMSLVSAAIGSSTLVLAGMIPQAAHAVVIRTWWVGDTAGVLVFAPPLLAWRAWREQRWPARLVLESVVSLLLLMALVALVFGQRYTAEGGTHWHAYLIIVCIGWSSYRHGMRGTSVFCLLSAIGAVLGTIHGLGPFVAGTLNDSLIALESFVVLCSVVGMVLCADASERQRLGASMQGRIAAQWATLFAGIGLTVLVWHQVASGTERRAREQFDTACAGIEQRIVKRMALYETGLRGAQAMLRAAPGVGRAQWRQFAGSIDIGRNFPGMAGLGYARYLHPEQRAGFELGVRADGNPQFRIFPAGGPQRPAAVVDYLEPFSGENLRAFGYDMLSEPISRAAMLEAARSGQPALSGKVTLVQQNGDDPQSGMLLYLPVYRAHAALATAEQRLAALEGFVFSPFRVNELMQGILAAATQDVQLEIFDGAGASTEGRLLASTARSAEEQLEYPNPLRREANLMIARHEWSLRFTSLPAFEATIDRQKSHIVLLAGSIISLLFFGVVRALTARHAYAETLAVEMTGALRASERSLMASRDLAEAASRAKTEFVANMSHEIRTPLNAVLGMSHLLANTPLTPEQHKYLEMIRQSGQSLLSILNDVLDFSKIEAGRMELSPGAFKLGDVLEALATIMTVNAGEKDLELAIGVEPDVPQSLMGDAHRLQQILVNLVGNAVKFTDAGSVTVLVQLADAAADGRPGAPLRLRFLVRDSGIGITPDLLQQLFQPFSQADASTTRRFGGTGLGLAISRRLAALMGGAIDVASTPGGGSQFALTVPLAVAPALAGAAAPSPLRLLVVDDDAVSADCLVKTVRAHGWLADSAHSGRAALARLTGQGGRYDAVLVDWNMPDMNGLATMQALRAAPASASLPVLLMVSAFGQGKLLHTDGAQAADAVLLKPVTAARLEDTLRPVLAGRQDEPAPPQPGAAPTPALAPRAEGVRLDGARILLVEDNPLNQLVANSMLTHAGAAIDVVEHGAAALERLRERAAEYDLVLMDVQMPVMDGFEATRRIRAELGLDLPVLAMTAGVMLSEREQCIACGMNDFIAKPIEVDQMLRVIARNLPLAVRSAAG